MDRSLKPCKGTPNCVCSEDDRDRHVIEPLTPKGKLDDLWKELIEHMGSAPRTKLVKQDSDYLHYEVASTIFRFVDDVEFLKKDGVVHVRSASRLGRADFGVNRRRIENLREILD